MKSYQILSDYYDQLILPEGSIEPWIEFTLKHQHGFSLHELACGSGAILSELKKAGFTVSGSDLSEEMLEKAREKLPDVSFSCQDMRYFTSRETYDTIVCYNDSINYLSEQNDLKEIFASVYSCLEDDGVFLFDVHTRERLKEFEEEFIEEGVMKDVSYQWAIAREDDHICHHLTFWFSDHVETEEHIQTVFYKKDIKKILKECGFVCEVYTDFTKPENSHGEKWYFVAKKDIR